MGIAEKQFEPDKNFLLATAKTIVQLRKENNFTQENLADVAKIHWRTVQRLELESPNFTIGLFDKIAEGFGLKKSEFMKKIEENMA